MIDRYLERRRHARMPAVGLLRWRSTHREGCCELVDQSAGGVGLRFPARHAPVLGERIELTPAEGLIGAACSGTVVRREPGHDDSRIVGVAF